MGITPPETSFQRAWTLIIYMAGDNGHLFDTESGKVCLMEEMTSVGYNDLMKMGAVGSTRNVAVVCLFDTLQGGYLVEVQKGRGFSDSVVHPLGNMNMGDPEVLIWFITHGIFTYPARHYALVIWSHGSGWPDVDGYASVRALQAKHKRHLPIFRRTFSAIASDDPTRPIAFDDSSKDFLDSQGLHHALEQSHIETGVRLALIGMDACLMAMVEGARELAPFADYFVASQEEEPMEGWPYTEILAALNGQPAMTPAELSTLIVKAYAEGYGGRTRSSMTITQSAIVLAHTATTEALCRTLVQSVLDSDRPGLRRLITEARDTTLAFKDSNFRDLGHFATRVAQVTAWKSYPAIHAAATALQAHLEGRGSTRPVLQVGYLPAYKQATGLSVYLPEESKRYAPNTYHYLAFARATGWKTFLDWLFELPTTEKGKG